MNKKNFKALIIMCWVLLAVCVIIKLFGGNWFELSTDNTKFIDFCAFVDNTMWIKMILACIVYCVSTYVIMCISCNKTKLTKKQTLIVIPIMIFKSLLTWYNSFIPLILDIVLLFGIPFLITKKWLRPLIVIGIVLLLQILTLVIRNIGLIENFNYNSTLISLLYQLDYYIMLLLLYFYNIKYCIRKEK